MLQLYNFGMARADRKKVRMSLLAAYVVPHPPLAVPTVGRGEENGIADTLASYREVARRIADLKPETIVITSPHAPSYLDCFCISGGEMAHGDMAQFRAPQTAMDIPYDTELVADICELAGEHRIPLFSGSRQDAILDHASFVPLYYVNEQYTDYKLVRIGLSGLPAEANRKLGRVIAEAIARLDRDCVFIASGDLSHKLLAEGPYGFAPEGPVFDDKICAILKSGDLGDLFDMDPALVEASAQCGLDSFRIMAGALDGLCFETEFLSYEGPFGVGYGSSCYTVVENEEDDRDD